MIVIYTQDKTYIRNHADTAKNVLLSVCGEKLGTEAYDTVKNAREGLHTGRMEVRLFVL